MVWTEALLHGWGIWDNRAAQCIISVIVTVTVTVTVKVTVTVTVTVTVIATVTGRLASADYAVALCSGEFIHIIAGVSGLFALDDTANESFDLLP